jgi:hypothetical protein
VLGQVIATIVCLLSANWQSIQACVSALHYPTDGCNCTKPMRTSLMSRAQATGMHTLEMRCLRIPLVSALSPEVVAKHIPWLMLSLLCICCSCPEISCMPYWSNAGPGRSGHCS